MASDNRGVKLQLGFLYGLKCMITDEETRLTLHHIFKKEYGGETSVRNGIILHELFHRWLHSLENYDRELFELVNESFILYKQCIDENRTDLVEQYQQEVIPKLIKRSQYKSKNNYRR